MKCPNCQKEIENDSVFCEYCGTRINQAPVNNTTVNAEESKLGCGLSFLSFLIPLVGFALYFKYKDTEIEKARQAARIAWISIVLGIIFNIISLFINHAYEMSQL